MTVAVSERYCNFCGTEERLYGLTRDEKIICQRCAKEGNFCAVCGSLKAYAGQPDERQIHYDESCFQ